MAGRVGDSFNTSPEVASRTPDYRVEATGPQHVQPYLDAAALSKQLVERFPAYDSIGPKFDTGKPRWSLLPSGTIIEVIKVLEFGAQKYSRESWKQVPDGRTRYYDATMRHLEAWFSGEKTDKETGISHLAHAMCNLLFLLWKDKNEQST